MLRSLTKEMILLSLIAQNKEREWKTALRKKDKKVIPYDDSWANLLKHFERNLTRPDFCLADGRIPAGHASLP